MPLLFLPKMKWKPAALVLAASCLVCANTWAAGNSAPAVQTYTNQAVPASQQTDASYGTPIDAGQMTLEDVLETHPLPKKPALQPPNLAAGNITSAPPVLASSMQAS